MTRDDCFYAWFRREHRALHEAWTKDVGTPGYKKSRWLDREADFLQEARGHASRIGIVPPYLYDCDCPKCFRR